MIVLSNSASQTLAAGQAITFDTLVRRCGNSECHRTGSPSVKLRCKACYKIFFSANVMSTTTDPIQLSIQAGGETLPETTRITTPAEANEVISIATQTAYDNCCCDYSRLTVVNTGTTDIVIEPNSSFMIYC